MVVIIMTNNIEKYEGETKDGKPHGKGTAIYENGDQFEGNFKDGSASGLSKCSVRIDTISLNICWVCSCFFFISSSPKQQIRETAAAYSFVSSCSDIYASIEFKMKNVGFLLIRLLP